jgi:hypothetical protein
MKRFFFPAAVVIILLALITQSFGQDPTYQHKIDLRKMTFEWSLEPNLIHVKISANTSGWVGIGFNPVHAMKGANFILGYVQDGKAQLKNQFGDSNFHHDNYEKPGGESEITNISGKESNGITEIAFTLPLKSEVNPGNVIKTDQDIMILLAHGPAMKSFTIKHTYKSEIKVNLSTGTYREID